MLEWLKPSGECLECRAVFIGTNGSMGYETNVVYRVMVFIRDSRIWIRCRSHTDCPYDTMVALTKNGRFL